jgi:hypothetical protein
MWPKKRKRKEKEKFDSYYLEIHTANFFEIFTMALIQCEILHLTVKSLIFKFFKFFWDFFFKSAF